ncbi:choice-of-anchor G family protein, partial [Microbacterium album]|uniref:choice-of-anchor G family protein n=1 Tax=Microbacterium album TaxID=2053191 RepID=UPI001662D818
MTAIAAATTASLVAGGAAYAAPGDYSEAQAQLIASDLLQAELLDAVGAQSGFPSDAGPNSNALDLGALSALDVELGALTLPLVSSPGGPGLLDLGEVGALNAFAASPSATSSTASAGAVGADGAIALDPANPGALGPATVNLTDLLAQVGVDAVTDNIIDNLALELGALASTATSTAGVPSSEYVIAGADLRLSSPLVAGLSAALSTQLNGVAGAIETTLSGGGLIDQIVDLVDLDLGIASLSIAGGTVNVTGVEAGIASLVDDVLGGPVTSGNGLVTVDFSTGEVIVHLENLVAGGSLNGLDPNTLLLDSGTASQITGALTEVLGTVVGQLVTGTTGLLNDITLTIVLPVEVSLGIPIASGSVTISTSVGGLLAGTAPTIDPSLSLLGGIFSIDRLAGLVTGALTTPVGTVLGALSTPLTNTLGTLTGTLNGVIDPLLASLSPVFGALNQVVEITINEQPTPGYLGAESFTVNALSLELLPGLDALDLDLASSTVRSAAAEPVLTIAAGDPVYAGASAPLSGAGWPGNATVEVTLEDAAGDVVATTTITTDAEGNVPATASIAVPSGTPAGTDYVLTGTSAGALSATDDVTVYAPTVSAAEPVNPGDDI